MKLGLKERSTCNRGDNFIFNLEEKLCFFFSCRHVTVNAAVLPVGWSLETLLSITFDHLTFKVFLLFLQDPPQGRELPDHFMVTI